jgi:PST family polysaccharide transporter
MVSFRKKVIEGLTWSGIAQAGKQVCQLAITMVLAHILAPQEFGLMAMANVFIGFATLLSEMGIGNALVQRKELSEEHRSSAFWLNMAVGAFFVCLSFLVSPGIARFYRRPELVPIINVLSISFLVSAVAVVQQSLLMRAMDFRSLMIRDIAATVLSGVLGIILAVKGYGVWSLVFQMLAWVTFNNLFLWFFSPWRPRLLFSKKAVIDLMGFSLNMTGFQMVNYLARTVDQLLIGRFLGAQSLGYYAMAYKLMLFPIQNISWVITRVMFPAFSRIQDNLPRVAENYAKMVGYVSLITFPMMMLFFIVAPDLIPLLWGRGWEETVRIVRVLCFCGMVQSIVTVGGSVYLSQGRAGLQFRMSLANVALTTLSVVIGLQWGVFGVAVAYTVFNLLWSPVSIYVVMRILRHDVVTIYRILARNLMAGLIPFVVLTGLKQYLILEPVVLICTLILAGGAIYVSAIALMKKMRIISW